MQMDGEVEQFNIFHVGEGALEVVYEACKGIQALADSQPTCFEYCCIVANPLPCQGVLVTIL
eukprot:1159268-Pelagomonas_calceolata.AAC.2